MFKRSYVEITLYTSTPGGLYFNAAVISDNRAVYLLFDYATVPVEIEHLELALVKAMEDINKLLSED